MSPSSDINELIIGYSIRLPDVRRTKADDRMRMQFLLREDIDYPKSVDTMIWPATSDNFENLYSLIPVIPADIADGVLIAISVLASYAEDILKNLEGEIRFIPPDPNWPLLGYDVADDGFISGLSNCGYEPVEKCRWQAEWNPKINQHGLISNASDALKFKLQADERVSEHSPFYVFGVYLINEEERA